MTWSVLMAERGIVLTHTAILRWVQRYVPDFEKRWNRYALPVGDSWRADGTYIKGQWVYLYRAVDKAGRTVDFLLSNRRDAAAAFAAGGLPRGLSLGLPVTDINLSLDDRWLHVSCWGTGELRRYDVAVPK